MPQPSEIGSTLGKLTKALPDPPLFTDGKDPSIDQWLSKMRGKFEINWDHYPLERSKLIYAVMILSLITAYHIHGMIRNSCQLCVSHVTVMLSFVL